VQVRIFDGFVVLDIGEATLRLVRGRHRVRGRNPQQERTEVAGRQKPHFDFPSFYYSELYLKEDVGECHKNKTLDF
jgi:hypothetical protein